MHYNRLLIFLFFMIVTSLSINASGGSYTIGKFTLSTSGAEGAGTETTIRTYLAPGPGFDNGNSTNYRADVGFFDSLAAFIEELRRNGVAFLLVSNVLISMTAIGVFTVLFLLALSEKNQLYHLWLGALILVFIYALAVQRDGFESLGFNTSADMVFALLDALIWIGVAIFMLSVMYLVNLLVKNLRALTGGNDG